MCVLGGGWGVYVYADGLCSCVREHVLFMDGCRKA